MTSNQQSQQFKKGDVVYVGGLFGSSDSEQEGRALVCASLVTLTSYGKQQGTATYLENDKVMRKRIYPHEQLFRTRDDVIAFAETAGITFSRFLIPEAITAKADWLRRHESSSRTEVVARVKRAKIDLESATPSVRVWFYDGTTQEDVILTETK